LFGEYPLRVCHSLPTNALAGRQIFYDHTYGNSPLSQFLVIDGHPTAAADVWTQPINVSAGKTYCFSFWVARVYPTAFNLGVTINGVLVDPSAVFSVNSGAWTQTFHHVDQRLAERNILPWPSGK
jgi:hypothetical protein